MAIKEAYSMKRMIAGTCLAAAFAVGLSAQTYPPQTQPPTPQTQPPAAQETKDAAKTVTVTGCLKAGDQPDTFILSDLKWSKDKDKAVGTSGSAAAPIAASTLKLIGSPSAKLSEHLNKTVEVSGMISDVKAATPSTPPSPSDPPRAKADPTLNVKTVSMVSSSCSAQ
jgi:hypothetical protein